jgi:hypothetical protein
LTDPHTAVEASCPAPAPVVRGVRFDEERTAIIDRGEVLLEDLDLLWYNEEEYKAMKLSDLTGLWISRGLEDCFKNECRKQHIQRILALQQDHRKANTQDADGLKTLSMTLSRESCKEALRLAEKEAMDVFRANRKSPYMLASTAQEYAKKTKVRSFIRRSQTMKSGETADAATTTRRPYRRRSIGGL